MVRLTRKIARCQRLDGTCCSTRFTTWSSAVNGHRRTDAAEGKAVSKRCLPAAPGAFAVAADGHPPDALVAETITVNGTFGVVMLLEPLIGTLAAYDLARYTLGRRLATTTNVLPSRHLVPTH